MTKAWPYEGCMSSQVVHRHGARTVWAPLNCWAPEPGATPELPRFECDSTFPKACRIPLKNPTNEGK